VRSAAPTLHGAGGCLASTRCSPELPPPFRAVVLPSHSAEHSFPGHSLLADLVVLQVCVHRWRYTGQSNHCTGGRPQRAGGRARLPRGQQHTGGVLRHHLHAMSAQATRHCRRRDDACILVVPPALAARTDELGLHSPNDICRCCADYVCVMFASGMASDECFTDGGMLTVSQDTA